MSPRCWRGFRRRLRASPPTAGGSGRATHSPRTRETHADGRHFIGDAIARGASCVLWETRDFSWKREWAVAQSAVPDLKMKLGAIADVIYGDPSHALWVVGVTGTNGKTSCAHWIAAGTRCLGATQRAARHAGQRPDRGVAASASTRRPTPPCCTRCWRSFAPRAPRRSRWKCRRTASTRAASTASLFDVALFTNLSRDHLDYHGTMAAYGAAKARLFGWPGLRVAVINADDPFGQSLIDASRTKGRKLLTYGFGAADVVGRALTASGGGIAVGVETPWGKGEIHTQFDRRLQRVKPARACSACCSSAG